MAFKKYSEVIFGVVILAFGAFYFMLTRQLPRKAPIDAAFVPYILSAFMLILGTLQVMSGYKVSKAFKEDEHTTEKLDYLTVLKIISLIVVYIALLQPIGFIICTIVFLVLAFSILAPAGEKKNYIQYVIISIISTLLIYFIFRNGLSLMLPRGILRIGR